MENSLHLDLNSLTLDSSKNAESTAPATSVEDISTTQSESPDSSDQPSDKSPEVAVHESRERKKPYVNPERVNTGGSQRDKLSEEELTERMERIRQQNEKIKQRRVDVQADEDAFRKTQQNERAKLARIRKVQEAVNNTREQNAKRKMDKIQSREWDSGKHSPGDWKARNQPTQISPPNESQEADASSVASSQWARGGSASRGSNRGRGRGRGSRRGGRPVTPAEVSDLPDSGEAPGAGWEPWGDIAESKPSIEELEDAVAL
ncbi:MAG: hypothetical protein NXY57DRAFT_1016138 [Lentinula lateritia]|uniref:Uncharacterized protein n=1 Tax=Lentinula lateritia TaxID=40482 RepID=A0ABQ8VZ71_9AGAR|nr:MAG: hypothetical protein NXY57DRAFT_1016138 [Lentinula lateritia]KAJ4501681.1 hypothetical protein C8R41DRAFT_805457 [Lentinula lateritia]